MNNIPDIPELKADEVKKKKEGEIFGGKNVSQKKYINLSLMTPVF